MHPTASIEVFLTPNEINISKISDLSVHNCGAVVVFTGKTRQEEHREHGILTSLNYSCYEELAQKTIEEIALEATQRFPVHAIRIAHSTGEVKVNEPSVVIAVGGLHRAEAFEACRFLIDAIKDRVAIWKKEQWSHGSTWSEGKEIKL